MLHSNVARGSVVDPTSMSKVDSTSRIDGSNSQGRVMSNFQRIRGALRLMAAAALSLLVVFDASAQTVRYIHVDGLGSVVLMTDKDRNVVERSEYEPYGSLLNRPVADRPGFTGHVMDAATGLTYMQQRYYDSSLGIFLSVDPIYYGGNIGGHFNRYRYANENPYKFIDPDGRASCLGGFCDKDSATDQPADTSRAQQESDQELGKPPIKDMEPVKVTAPKRQSARVLRSKWEKYYGRVWPKDPSNPNRNQDVAHKQAVADQGDPNDPENYDPQPHDEHMKEHKERGDFKRWGARSKIGPRSGMGPGRTLPEEPMTEVEPEVLPEIFIPEIP